MVRPILSMVVQFCTPPPPPPTHTQSIPLQDEIEKVQKMKTRFVTGSCIYEPGGITGILEQLKWESPKKRRKGKIVDS